MNTAVVILNWNGIEHLQTYLPSVIEHSNARVFIIDNGSLDNSVVWISETYPDIGIVQLEKNLGFAGGYNAGLKEIDADRYVLLNSDVRVSSGWIESVNNTMSQNGWSACSPLILDDKNNESDEYDNPSSIFELLLLKYASIFFLIGKLVINAVLYSNKSDILHYYWRNCFIMCNLYREFHMLVLHTRYNFIRKMPWKVWLKLYPLIKTVPVHLI